MHTGSKFTHCVTAKQFGATECVNPLELKTSCEEAIVAMTDGGCDYTFECIGNVKTMVSIIFR